MSSGERDPMRFIEAAYAFGHDEQRWMQGMVDVLAPYNLSGGIAAYISNFEGAISVRSTVNETRMPTDVITAMVTELPDLFYRRLHDPMPLVHSHSFFPMIATRTGFHKLRGIVTDYPFAVPFPTPPAAWAFAGGDADIETALVVFHCKPDEKHSARDQHSLDCFAAHLGSALRLRSLLKGDELAGDHAAVEAVFAPDGRLLDARGELKEEEERSPLLDAVLKSEKAKLRSASSDERLDVWTALLEGRWSVLENTERDGKRMLLACRNDPRATPLRALTPREQAVLSYAARGHSFKYIGYELGISIATAEANCKRALRKVGLKSRAELIQLLAGR